MIGKPITLKAETPGQVILNGTSSIDISGDSLVVDGLRFEGGALSSGHIVEFKRSFGEPTNSHFTGGVRCCTHYIPTPSYAGIAMVLNVIGTGKVGVGAWADRVSI